MNKNIPVDLVQDSLPQAGGSYIRDPQSGEPIPNTPPAPQDASPSPAASVGEGVATDAQHQE